MELGRGMLLPFAERLGEGCLNVGHFESSFSDFVIYMRLLASLLSKQAGKWPGKSVGAGRPLI